MADISLIRVDYRLIHGQVAVKWAKTALATKIVVIDDKSAGDKTLKTVLKLAAPQGTKCLVYSVERAAAKWQESQFGEGMAMVLFKEIADVHRAWKLGMAIPKLQLGNIPSNPVRKVLQGEVYASAEEMDMLREMAEAGTDIEIHTIPEQPGTSFARAEKKYSD